MTTTAMKIIATVDVQHIEDLTNADLDALLDGKILGHSAWCQGRIEHVFRSSGEQDLAIWQCSACGANEHAAFRGRHPRLVPCYTASMPQIWPVIEAIAAGHDTEVQFMLELKAAMKTRGPLASSLFLHLEPRAIAVAALKVFGVIDAYGFVVDRPGSR